MPRRILQHLFPASFYGRAVLILIIPIIAIQIVLSVVFIQRHYERVTAQMTTNILRDIRFLTERLNASPDPQIVMDDLSDLVAILQIDIRLPPEATRMPEQEQVGRFDLAGREILRVLRADLSAYRTADLMRSSSTVRIWIDSRHGILEIQLPRRLVTTSNPHQLLVIVFLASVLMTLIAFQFLRLQIRPIRRLGAAAEAYGRGERVALRATGAREIRAAAHGFIDMRNRIERQRAQHKIMLSGVSHDMRTPLTRMRLILSMMPESDDRTALEIEIADLEKRLDGFLDYTRGQAQEERQATDPLALIANLVERYRAAGHKITLSPSGKRPKQVFLHRGSVARALDNLISNALRHSDRVAVHLSVNADWLEYSVEDNGPGIPPEDRTRACEPFVRLDEARNSESGGMGLGLAIAAEAARAHGGTLELEDSEALGGLRAVLRLPARQSL
jgi:two-component system osmolarity sensor histidine kinase EnvZ